MGTEALQEILRQHQRWLASDGTEGSRADLRGADLSRADLMNAKLSGADLRGAYLSDVNFIGADLSGANLRGTVLVDADLSGADLLGANLLGADLRGADLNDANFEGANLRSADLHGANLEGTDFEGANLRSADLHGANLEGTDFEGADLRDANLSGTNLCSADLRNADLEGANLRGAYLSDADLKGANLRAADLSHVRFLTQPQLAVAFGDTATKIPADLIPPAHWLKTEAQPPRIPEQPLAPVRTRISGDRVVLSDAQAESPTAPSDLKLHQQELLDEVQHLSEGAGNHPQLRRVLGRYQEALGAPLNELQEIRLGLRGLGVEELSKQVADLLPEDKVAAYHALAVSHQIFMQQFPKWQEYISTPQEPLSAHQSQRIEEATPSILHAAREVPEKIDRRIPDSIEQDHNAANESGNSKQRRGMLDSLRNLLGSVARLATKAGTTIAARVFLGMFGGGYDRLIEAFPTLLAWAKAVKEYLQAAFSGSDSDDGDDDGDC